MNIKKLLLYICIIVVTLTGFGQTNKVDFGIEGGAGLINLRGSENFNENQDPSIGYSGGVFFRYNFKKIISLHCGLSAETKGTSTTIVLTDQFGNPIGEFNQKTNLFYLSLPILMRASFGEKNIFFINGGGYLGYLLSENSSQTTGIGMKSPFKEFDYGISCGLGFTIPIQAKDAFSLEIRYNLGLNDINNTNSTSDGIIKTNSMILLLSYAHKFGFRTN